MSFLSKVTINEEVFTHEHETLDELKDTLRSLDPRDLYNVSNIIIFENGRLLDGSETLMRLILA